MKKITRYCKSCKSVEVFVFIGTQKDSDGKPLFNLFNCTKCKTTIAVK